MDMSQVFTPSSRLMKFSFSVHRRVGWIRWGFVFVMIHALVAGSFAARSLLDAQSLDSGGLVHYM